MLSVPRERATFLCHELRVVYHFDDREAQAFLIMVVVLTQIVLKGDFHFIWCCFLVCQLTWFFNLRKPDVLSFRDSIIAVFTSFPAQVVIVRAIINIIVVLLVRRFGHRLYLVEDGRGGDLLLWPQTLRLGKLVTVNEGHCISLFWLWKATGHGFVFHLDSSVHFLYFIRVTTVNLRICIIDVLMNVTSSTV